MPISIDPYHILLSVASNSEAFEHIDNDIEKAARSLVEKSIKSTKMNHNKLCAVRKALGQDLFSLILEDLPQKTLQTVCKRIDRHHEYFKRGAIAPDENWLRKHILDLACNKISPSEKVTKQASRSQSKKTETKTKSTKIGKRNAVSAKRRR